MASLFPSLSCSRLRPGFAPLLSFSARRRSQREGRRIKSTAMPGNRSVRHIWPLISALIHLYHNLAMHLPQNDGHTFTGHVARSHAMFDAIGSIGILLHHANAAPREGDDESSIAEAVELAPER